MRQMCAKAYRRREATRLSPGSRNPLPPEEDDEIILFASFVAAGVVPPFSRFLTELLGAYGVKLAHLTPNAVVALASFAYLCEMFVGIRPNIALFRRYFQMRRTGKSDLIG